MKSFHINIVEMYCFELFLQKIYDMRKSIIFTVLLLSLVLNSTAQQTKSISPGLLFSLDKIDTDAYYYGKLNDSVCYVKFESVNGKNAEGYYFIDDKNVFAETHKFKLYEKRKSYILELENETIEIKPDFLFRENSIIGKYGVNEKFLKIFKNYKWSKYVEFKKYEQDSLIVYPARYKKPVFEVDVLNDVVYGNAKGYMDSYPAENESYLKIIEKGVLSTVSKRDLDLRMDIYMPRGDTLTSRPLIMFIHGGGFYIGDKKSEAMVEWCKYFASLGYVTASINYRLGYKLIGPSVERAGYRALQDAHAAMRFLVHNSDKYGINKDLLFVGGSSAGGVTSLNLAFMRNKNRPETTRNSLLYDDQGDIETSTNNLKDNFEIDAVVNMWGAVNDLALLKNSNASIISFHGDADDVVPINHDYPFKDIKGNFSSVILNKMYGSLVIHIEAKKLGLREELHIFEAAGHSPHVDVDDNLNENFYFISEKIRDFLYEEVIKDECRIVSHPATPFNRALPYYKITCDNYRDIYWSIEGGIITGKKDNLIKVIWFKEAPKHKLVVSGSYNDGAGFYDVYEF